MATKTIEAGVAMMKVLESWGVKHVYGYPGGSISSTMHALEVEQERIKYVQVRHEQVGALAAAGHAKATGEIGVTFGSAGPGAVNLLNGLYDAKEDNVPVLAIVGQVPSTNMNYDYFQEFPEIPMFSDVADYNRIVMTAESLPYVIDKAIREAYKNQGVSVVVIPNNLGFVEIEDIPFSSAQNTDRKPAPEPEATDEEVAHLLAMIKEAKRPVFHVGSGIKGNQDKLQKLAEKLQIPVVITGLAKGKVDDNFAGNMGTSNRAASKAADEIFGVADLVIALGANFPFANLVYRTHEFKFVQIDNDKAKFGRHHYLDYSIWSDSGKFLDKALEMSEQQPASPFYQAAVEDMQNWKEYLNKLMNKTDGALEYEQVYREINRIAEPDALFSVDVGDNIINSFRFLDMKREQKMTISALFATMGYGLPGAIAGQFAYPERQVFNIAGDGAFSMVMQDLLTLNKYNLPVINVITSNQFLSFIKSEQDDLTMNNFGVDLKDANFKQIAEAMGVHGIEVNEAKDLAAAFDEALATSKAGKPVLIDANITSKRGLPVEELQLEIEGDHFVEYVSAGYQETHGKRTLEEFFAEYDAQELKSLPYYFEKYGVTL
ncbi:pyruvate oxidase [Ligilactobacillus salitolerans]|uniref:Pyruvate oxidase n=2 Tax=Ligilactobacillus salitolerans TaxID=1808352 RepID=A0A401IW42_9LACO|nr:pyruvate oxidase [Ligilactobacillus salitolerans]